MKYTRFHDRMFSFRQAPEFSKAFKWTFVLLIKDAGLLAVLARILLA